ncbi:MAG: hypothetical protein AAF443_06790 [Chlamydiota bacterium]
MSSKIQNRQEGVMIPGASQPGQASNISNLKFLTQKLQEVFQGSKLPTWAKSATKIVSITGVVAAIAIVAAKYLLPLFLKPTPRWNRIV